MDWGMANRMAQLIQSDGKCMFLPVDHGYFQGPTRSLERPGETIAPLLPYADALFATRGVVRAVVDPANAKPLILRVSGGTSMANGDLADEDVTTSMEDAIRMNVSAVGISVFIGSDYQKQSIINLGRLVDEGERYGIPVMAVTAVGRELESGEQLSVPLVFGGDATAEAFQLSLKGTPQGVTLTGTTIAFAGGTGNAAGAPTTGSVMPSSASRWWAGLRSGAWPSPTMSAGLAGCGVPRRSSSR